MMNQRYTSPLLLALGITLVPGVQADDLGDVKLDMRLRYEYVDQDNPLKDADGLTLRTRLTYLSPAYRGFSGLIEFEDSRQVLGVDSYNDTLGQRPNYSVIADPETTELDQGLVQYQNDRVTAKLGRQVITLDNHRYVGHVGWRQDRQTFDAATLTYTPGDDLTLRYGYITQRNRIFAEERDLDAKDHILNLGYRTPLGQLTGYAYLLEIDDAPDNDLDSYGVRFAGQTQETTLPLHYALEYAYQESDDARGDFDTDYLLAELGTTYQGIKVTLGYELLGSDDGDYGFSTPLATLHKFNGWADQFLNTPAEGLEDIYLQVGGPLLGGKWLVVYHDFSADEDSATVDDLGSEWDLLYTRPIDQHFSAGIKYAGYSDGDRAAGKVDTDKVWAWVSYKL